VSHPVYLTVKKFVEENQRVGSNLPLAEDAEILSQPITVENVTVPNRFACQAMEGCDGTKGGSPDELTKRRYRRFAEGGSGLIWFEATAVMEEARANPRQLYIHEGNLDDFKRQVEEIREAAMKACGHRVVIVMQATHSGRYSKPFGTPAPWIAYSNPLFEKDAPISEDRIVSDDHLDRVKEALIAGAQLAERAGFDGVDVKCCHRYLNSELLSAYTRPGKYGGSLENRTRLLRESIAGAKAVTSSGFLVTTRLNLYDGFPYPFGFGVSRDGGLLPDYSEPIWLLKELKKQGVKLINATMGNPYVNPHVNRPYSVGGYEAPEHPLLGVKRMLEGIERVKQSVPEISFVSSGLSYLGVAAPLVASAMIRRGAFDFAGFGRSAFAYPNAARDVMDHHSMDPKKICISCSKCTQLMRAGDVPGCVIRDEVYRERFQKVFGGTEE